jgi:hypothetical protein
MRLIRAHRQAASGDIHTCPAGPGTGSWPSEAGDGFGTRREPEAFAARGIAADPYALWLAQREAEKDAERPEIRWVYRHERVTRPATTFEELGAS